MTTRVLVALILCLVATLAHEDVARAQECRTQSFLLHDGLVYASDDVLAGAAAPGAAIGEGEIDRPVSEDGCEREHAQVSVLRAGDLDPAVAVAVEGAPGVVFLLGGPCAGYEGDARRECVLAPLRFEGRSYTGSRYPSGGGGVALGAELGQAKLAGATVTAVRIDGVDPSVAVGVAGRPDEAFLAPGICPYQRFAATEEADDLRRCLEAPFWLAFEPLGARYNEEVVGRSDRVIHEDAEGATVSLVRLETATADIAPDDLSGAVPIGAVVLDDAGRVTVRFAAPDVEQGLYEAIVSCEACAASFGGQTTFPAGSLIVFERRGSSGPKIVLLGLGALFVVALVASVVMWRRGWRFKRRRRGRRGAGA